MVSYVDFIVGLISWSISELGLMIDLIAGLIAGFMAGLIAGFIAGLRVS